MAVAVESAGAATAVEEPVSWGDTAKHKRLVWHHSVRLARKNEHDVGSKTISKSQQAILLPLYFILLMDIGGAKTKKEMLGMNTNGKSIVSRR